MQLYFLSLIDGTGTASICKWQSCHGVGEGALETRGRPRLFEDGWIAVEGMENRATGQGPPTSLACPKHDKRQPPAPWEARTVQVPDERSFHWRQPEAAKAGQCIAYAARRRRTAPSGAPWDAGGRIPSVEHQAERSRAPPRPLRCPEVQFPHPKLHSPISWQKSRYHVVSRTVALLASNGAG
ncbi:hypothetical protein AOQ84DRAFT_221897 [Glonium stellatum]|uniref:Uncharacterized protein n=1 Tax=Glonium stellatum TaxID=574774 RepID=A0A8E2F0X5_9PEZI|nr:hypothetical protein AOQ84DRAFT_221897 [Glonium stellatum]